ncbi:hypothetical protein [Rhodohalobacter sp.]|uniref:hypothetical protein n=1 Tax=Rhodohalobacter sp. TaxID=1974210 RepID=UPI002ACDFEED|nr:hypothetical protein [Rhodohalobacter sp.]
MCDMIAGGANNILDNEEKHGNELIKKGILYAPDSRNSFQWFDQTLPANWKGITRASGNE